MTAPVFSHRDRKRELESLHRGLIVDLDRGRTVKAVEGDSVGQRRTAVRSEAEFEENVSASIGMIERVSAVIETLQDTVRRHEDSLYEFRDVVSKLELQRDDAFRELANAEQVIRSERQRVQLSEGRANIAEARIKQLEDQTTVLSTQLERLMTAVDLSLSGIKL